jgi:hypothetical protein
MEVTYVEAKELKEIITGGVDGELNLGRGA